MNYCNAITSNELLKALSTVYVEVKRLNAPLIPSQGAPEEGQSKRQEQPEGEDQEKRPRRGRRRLHNQGGSEDGGAEEGGDRAAKEAHLDVQHRVAEGGLEKTEDEEEE